MSGTRKKNTLLKKASIGIAIGLIAGGIVVAKRMVDPGENVANVIDGDTFQLPSKQLVRLMGVDAPELENCFGYESKEALTKKISGEKVVLKEVGTDMYRRILALVYLDGELVNEYMAKNGYAESHRDAGSQTDIINKAADFAKSNKLGIFSPKCYQLNPPDPKCLIKGNITQDKNTKFYYVPGCNHYTQTVIEKYKGEQWFCTEAEAQKAGFKKAPECN